MTTVTPRPRRRALRTSRRPSRLARALATPLAAVGVAVVAFMLAAPEAAAQQRRIPGELPPNPDPNACYARVWIPGATRQQPVEEIVQDAAEEIIVEPAQYDWVEREVEIETAAERIEVTPARFEMQRREIILEPAREEVTVEPPIFETIDKPVLVRPAYQAWRPCRGRVDRIETPTGEVMCFQTVPAEFDTIKARVLRQPARVVRRQIPAKTQTVEVRVMVERPRRQIIRIPAKTRTVRVLEKVREERILRRAIPERRAVVQQTVPASEGRVEWWPVLCESNTRPSLVRDIQRALRRRGFDPGPIDGRMGPRTLAAIEQFQRRNNLPEGGLLIDTLQQLGVDLSG